MSTSLKPLRMREGYNEYYPKLFSYLLSLTPKKKQRFMKKNKRARAEKY